jgi:TetR/AcrR family transcriptional regulator
MGGIVLSQAFDHLPPERQKAIIDVGINAFAQHGYGDVSTDAITKACGIAKGLLFHYFGSKRAYYLRCMRTALDRLMVTPPEQQGGGFYDILFASMDQKLLLYQHFPSEIHFMNIAAWDTAPEIAAERSELFREYQALTATTLDRTIARATEKLQLREPNSLLVREALALYISAVNQKFLIRYRDRPEAFFQEAATVKAQIKEYIDLMLHGIAEGEQS